MVKHRVSHQASQTRGARRAQHHRLESNRRRCPGHGEEVGFKDKTRDRRPVLVGDHRREDVPERRRAVGRHGCVHGVDDVDDVPGRGDVGGDAVVHGHELELRPAPVVRRVEPRVEHGDGEPPGVERVGELEHRVDVALEW